MTEKKKVILYSTPMCVYCGMTKKLFEKHGVSFEERDVLNDPVAREEMEKKSGQRCVPVIEIGNHIFVGFNRNALEAALGIGVQKNKKWTLFLRNMTKRSSK